MSSFVRFVLKHKNEDSAVGDVARDMLQDTRIKRTWCYATVKKHLDEIGACGSVYNVLSEASERYKSLLNPINTLPLVRK
jgi:hypothetical protein